MEKNEECELEIIDHGMDLEGIAKKEDMVIFVPGAIKGEKVKIKIIKKNRSYAIGKIEAFLTKSENRCEPFCEVYKRCGGCNAQHLSYSEQLLLKQEMVKNVLLKQKVEYQTLHSTLGMGIPLYYRNKVQYPIRANANGEMEMGFYAKRSHDLIQNTECPIQNERLDAIAKYVFTILKENEFSGYDEKRNVGDIRHIMVRRGLHTGEVMIVIIVNHKERDFLDRLKKIAILMEQNVEDIVSVYVNINDSKTNEILGKEEVLLSGKEYIFDYIGEKKYAISPKSFFQVNTIQAEVLYETLRKMLHLKGDETLFDLYSGVGSIGIFLSDFVGKVYGIEIEKQAVQMANINIQNNQVKNAEYIAGSVEEKIVEFQKRNIVPDVIVVDPPRKGLDEKSIEYLLQFRPKKIGYVSCKPSTLARDLKLLERCYNVVEIVPVDMFPQTSNVECVALLCLKDTIK